MAHRVGLIPINCDPSKLEDLVGEDETDKDTIVFHFDVECTDETVATPKGETRFKNETAYASALTWLPQGNQLEVFPGTTVLDHHLMSGMVSLSVILRLMLFAYRGGCSRASRYSSSETSTR